eukprot:4637166-Pyramimonas_sp.AAC.1
MVAAAGLSLSDVTVDTITASSVAVTTTITFGPTATASPSAFASALLSQPGSIFTSAAFLAYGDAQVAGLQTLLSWPTLAPTVRGFLRSRSALPSNFHGCREERAGGENSPLSPQKGSTPRTLCRQCGIRAKRSVKEERMARETVRRAD